ncbi:MAG: hypothetical protein ACK5L5_12085 [Bacteroidales bacterium]
MDIRLATLFICILSLMSCSITDKKIGESDNRLYCQKEICMLSAKSIEDMPSINLDSFQTLEGLSRKIKTLYSVNCSKNAAVAVNIRLILTEEAENCTIGENASSSECIIPMRYSNICMLKTKTFPTMRDVLYYVIICDSAGRIFDITSPEKSEEDILYSSFCDLRDADVGYKKVCKLVMEDEMSIANLKSVLNRVIFFYIGWLNIHSQEKYKKRICELDSTQYESMLGTCKFELEVDMLPISGKVVVSDW